ncbi:hypothetical protein [Thalassospira povalilytica]|uniref:hypothetical protein n=1 Tax=Thalassospira povalilytica TaxID=732237 RepID=UPI001D188DEE|nr:hypothetical protein [Thalassospira povalilytica]MCC4239329.1 hypothetical protein [Thalassospira povalilytica]
MQNVSEVRRDDPLVYGRFSNQRPVVIIEQNQENLDHLIDQYLGLADIILVPNAYIGLRMIKLFKSEDVEILAIEGLFGHDAICISDTKITGIWKI